MTFEKNGLSATMEYSQLPTDLTNSEQYFARRDETRGDSKDVPALACEISFEERTSDSQEIFFAMKIYSLNKHSKTLALTVSLRTFRDAPRARKFHSRHREQPIRGGTHRAAVDGARHRQ